MMELGSIGGHRKENGGMEGEGGGMRKEQGFERRGDWR